MNTPRIADAGLGIRHVFIRDLVLRGSIGVYPSEHAAPQRIRINIDLAVVDDSHPRHSRPRVGRDELSRVINYETTADIARRCVAAGHVQLVETLAERIAEQVLEDSRIRSVRVRVEKLDVFADAESAGVEIEWRQA